MEYHFVSNDTKLNNASSYFFISGFIISKIQYIPIALVSSALNLMSLLFYLIGYSLWFIASHFYPGQAKKNQEWYEFAQFKEQYLYAAALGLIATTISMMAIFSPIMLVLSGWLFFGSNIIWTIGEYNKLNNPPSSEENFSKDRQNAYVSYALSMSVIGFITAASTTAAFFIPVITIPLFIITTIICIGVGALALEYWLESKFGDYQPDISMDESYKQMSNNLGKKIHLEPNPTPEPYHGTKPLHSAPHDVKIKEPFSDPQMDLSSHTCKSQH
ncbi:TPA: hypothetical protein JBL19_05860 [Legionella pneumophila]|nr:hypothetical protein [Legionella pneumophila]HAT7795714.1 hypothetical protein [Legionella pneumophila]HAT8355439.1 hypothetical protein [Legionella pneumophila]HAU1192162.1 hypothetical protein [Legionella pneumophila]HAU1195622.1 hypothetical protein [Legionella pneumophila]